MPVSAAQMSYVHIMDTRPLYLCDFLDFVLQTTYRCNFKWLRPRVTWQIFHPYKTSCGLRVTAELPNRSVLVVTRYVRLVESRSLMPYSQQHPSCDSSGEYRGKWDTRSLSRSSTGVKGRFYGLLMWNLLTHINRFMLCSQFQLLCGPPLGD